MTPSQALNLLNDAELDIYPEKESRINPSFTWGQMFDVVRSGIQEMISRNSERPLDSIMEKRVHQAITNKRSPSY